MIRDTLIIALEAAWELDPTRLEKKLWRALEESPKECYNKSGFQGKVEEMSNGFPRSLVLCGISKTAN